MADKASENAVASWKVVRIAPRTQEIVTGLKDRYKLRSDHAALELIIQTGGISKTDTLDSVLRRVSAHFEQLTLS